MSRVGVLCLFAALATGCATNKPFDYANFRQHRPRSILVLPPINKGTDIRGSYSYLSTVTRPLAEMGYYVFPVAMVDQFMRENGLPGPGEMHAAPLEKLAGVFGTDSVLYITLEQYGQRYSLFSSASVVVATAKLVDAKTGLLLWEGRTDARMNSGGGGGGGLLGALVEAAVAQAVNSTADTAHAVSADANIMLFTGRPPQSFGSAHAFGAGGPALLYGPYHAESVGAN